MLAYYVGAGGALDDRGHGHGAALADGRIPE
jgi:hypothetical protein